jgi:hypothetical protein
MLTLPCHWINSIFPFDSQTIKLSFDIFNYRSQVLTMLFMLFLHIRFNLFKSHITPTLSNENEHHFYFCKSYKCIKRLSKPRCAKITREIQNISTRIRYKLEKKSYKINNTVNGLHCCLTKGLYYFLQTPSKFEHIMNGQSPIFLWTIRPSDHTMVCPNYEHYY